jgi:hypothetical protein
MKKALIFIMVLSLFSFNTKSIFSVDVDFNPNLNIVRFIDNDIIRNVEIIHRPESCSIVNLDIIEPNQIVLDIINKPFENLELSIFSETSTIRAFNGIQELLKIFGVNLSTEIIEEINIINPNNKIIKISIENIDMYIYREWNILFKLFIVEYSYNNPYEPKIKIGSSKNEIISLLGTPSGYSEERNMFIYNSFRTYRQIVLFFENDIVNKVQFISWGGI